MRPLRKFLLLAALSCIRPITQDLPGTAAFDTLYLPFRHLGIEDGSSQGLVGSIVQDRAGFMWFSTKDGLNRYDGYSFRVFRNDPEDSTSIRDNHIMAVCEDRAGLLWVGTTYALVKDETSLTFTSRGKVQAKGKGEMEMYFVTMQQAT